MCFSFSVVMARSEPEVLAHTGETCCPCQLRGLHLRVGNVEQESDAAGLAQTLNL